MREVIQGVIATEGEAKRMVLSAKAEAEQIVSRAQQRAQELKAEPGREVELEAQQILTNAITSAEKQKRARLALSGAEIERTIDFKESDRLKLVEAVVRCVCG